MDPTNRRCVYRELANTYNNAGSLEPWESVEQFRRVREYLSTHPQKGSQAVATALDLPRSRIRPWVDGESRPAPVRAIRTLQHRGWADLSWRGETLSSLTILLAWIFSGGSVSKETYIPAFTTTERTQADVVRAANNLGIELKTRHADSSDRATEFIPADDASVFGRLLVSLGAPLGTKSTHESPSLPEYLDSSNCPHHLQLDFGRVVVRNRGIERDDRPNTPIQIREERSLAYQQSMRRLLGEIVGDSESVRGAPESDVTLLTERAAGVLCPRPTFGDYLD